MDAKQAEWAKETKAAGGKGWPAGKIKKAKKLAENLKGSAAVGSPQALARWAVARGALPK